MIPGIYTPIAIENGWDLDWSKPAVAVHNHIRGLSPEPGAWFEADLGKGRERIKVLRSAVAEGKGYDAAREIKLPKYESWSGYAAFLPMNIERYFDFWNRGI